MEITLDTIKIKTQAIIDLIASKNNKEANDRLIEASELLDELFDYSDDDADLIEISRYQVLLNQLNKKINNL